MRQLIAHAQQIGANLRIGDVRTVFKAWEDIVDFAKLGNTLRLQQAPKRSLSAGPGISLQPKISRNLENISQDAFLSPIIRIAPAARGQSCWQRQIQKAGHR
jgi:hypothetical protein